MQRIVQLWKSGTGGKLVVGCGSLISLPCLCAIFGPLFGQGITPHATTEVPAVASTPEPTDIPKPANTPTPTDTPRPTNTPRPTTITLPTSTPAASGPINPVFLGDRVNPPWWPCANGQFKGNRNSGIYHAPWQRDYARTYDNVECFNTAAEAEAAGYRAAKR